MYISVLYCQLNIYSCLNLWLWLVTLISCYEVNLLLKRQLRQLNCFNGNNRMFLLLYQYLRRAKTFALLYELFTAVNSQGKIKKFSARTWCILRNCNKPIQYWLWDKKILNGDISTYNCKRTMKWKIIGYSLNSNLK